MLSMPLENYAKALNEWDLYPVISTVYSGPVRLLTGLVQVVAAAIFIVLAIPFGWVNGLPAWRHDIVTNISEMGHGLGNLVRGVIAAVPLLGNVLLYLHDTPPSVTLKREEDGYYHFNPQNLPRYDGTFRARELQIVCGDGSILDTTKGIVPKGWFLKKAS